MFQARLGSGSEDKRLFESRRRMCLCLPDLLRFGPAPPGTKVLLHPGPIKEHKEPLDPVSKQNGSDECWF